MACENCRRKERLTLSNYVPTAGYVAPAGMADLAAVPWLAWWTLAGGLGGWWYAMEKRKSRVPFILLGAVAGGLGRYTHYAAHGGAR